MREFCRSQISRGKVMLSLTETRGPDARCGYGKLTRTAARRLAIAAFPNWLFGWILTIKFTLSHLLQFPELIIPAGDSGANELLLELCISAVKSALEDFAQDA